MVFNTDFALQVARDYQDRLLRAGTPRLEPVRPSIVRQRLGALIVRLGQAIEGRSAAYPNRAWQA